MTDESELIRNDPDSEAALPLLVDVIGEETRGAFRCWGSDRYA